MGVIYRALGFRFPCVVSGVVVWKNPNNVQIIHIFKDVFRRIDEFAAKNQMDEMERKLNALQAQIAAMTKPVG